MAVITAILKKDLRSLWPLALGGALLFLADALLSGIDLNVHADVIRAIDGVLPVACMLAMGLIIISAIQEDPADSLSHDWLTRPISSGEFAAAKLLTLFTIIAVPIFLSRFAVSLGTGHGLIESLLAASYARDGITLAAFPFFATVALLSRSTVQAIVVSLAILTLAILPLSLPEVMAQPSPLALLDDGTAQGVWWLYALPIALLVCLSLVLVFTFQYVKGRFGLARTAFGVTILLASPMMALPFFLPIWPMFFGLAETSLSGVDEEAVEGVRLYSMNDCFPAAKTADVTAGTYRHPDNIIGERFWREGEVYEISHGAVTYSTTLAARNVPIDWRVVPMKSVGQYAGVDTQVMLRPARNIIEFPSGKYDNTVTQYWFVRNKTVDALPPDTQLTQTHYLALLAPTSHDIEADGGRKYYSALGYCSAIRNTVRNEVEVDCFKRGVQPTLLSAELIDVPSSRVDAGPPNFAPSWLQWLAGERYEIKVKSPSFVENSKVRLTAYHTRGYLKKTMQFDGLLGKSASDCPVPSSEPRRFQVAGWHDTSPHQQRSVTIDGGVHIEVLDWGGTGPALLFVPGLGGTAHSLDEVAPLLRDDFHVYGMTRRGFGGSSRPDRGYDTARLSQDVLQVIEALELDSPVLVGHSAGGEELSWIGANGAENIGGLIYLDAAYDRTIDDTVIRKLARKLPLRPQINKDALDSYEAANAFLERMGIGGAPEGELMAMINLQTGARDFDPRAADALMAQVKRPRYEDITTPALAVYAKQTRPKWQAWFDRDDPYIQGAVTALFAAKADNQEKSIKQFENVKRGRVQVIPDADHYIIASNVEDVVAAIRGFRTRLLADTLPR